MALPPLSQWPWHVVFLFLCAGASIYGLILGKPVLQTGALQLPFAETLPFPYPLTTTFTQLLGTHALLRLVDFIKPMLEKNARGRFPARGHASIPLDDLAGSDESRLAGGRASIMRTLLLEIFPLALIIALEAALGNWVLYRMPLETYLLWRAFALPFLLVLDWMLFARARPGKIFYPSVALSISVFVTAFRPGLPHPRLFILGGIVSSGFASLWTLQASHRTESTHAKSKGGYSILGSVQATSRSGEKLHSIFSLLKYTSLLAAVILIPLLLYSGELGHMSRNCYILKEPRFWLYLSYGAVFRFIFLTSAFLLIRETSALTTTFFFVLVNVSGLAFFSFRKSLPSQVLAGRAVLLSAVWFLVTSIDLEQTWKPSWFGKYPIVKRLLPVGLIIITVSVLFGTVSQAFHEEPPVDSTPPHDRDDDGHFKASLYTSMVQGEIGYLGERPHVNATANLQLLMYECKGNDEQNTKDVFGCLDFLATKQAIYTKVHAQLQQKRSDEVDGNGESEDQSRESDELPDEEPENNPDDCDGRIIPYHILWSGLPTWRLELFIKAYLYTQNVPCSRLWIWINSELHPLAMETWLQSNRFERFKPLIERGDLILNEWKLPTQVPLPSQDKFDELDKARYYTSPPGRPNARGDTFLADSVTRDASGQEWLLFQNREKQIRFLDTALTEMGRLIILHQFGGVYLDTDMILLRDIRPLLLTNKAFVEKLGVYDPYDNAIIALPANSSASTYLLWGGTRMGLFYNPAVLNRMLLREGRDGSNPEGTLLKLETAFFDPIWAETQHRREGRCTIPCLSNVESVFKAAPLPKEWESYEGERLGGAAYNRTLQNFYPGAWAYRIHGQWSTSYERGSWLDVICTAHDRFFTGEWTNPYGEKWTGPGITHYRH